MKHWQELGHIAGRVARLGQEARRGESAGARLAALAMVTRIEGSAYRRPGARLLIEPDGSFLGGVSGGCLEADVRRIGQGVIESGRARLLHYETGDDEERVWGLGLGCNGEVDLAVQPIARVELGLFAELRTLLAGDAPFALATVVEEGGPGGLLLLGGSGQLATSFDPTTAAAVQAPTAAALARRRSGLQTVGGRQLFVEVLLPPPRLLVCGAGDDARPLVQFAAAVGFRVFVADHRPAFLTAERFPEAQGLLALRAEQPSEQLPAGPDTFAVVKTHSFEQDGKWAARLLACQVAYLGLLGPRARSEKILATIESGRRERVFAPVGLDLGADGPEQVALSVVAELLAVWSGRRPQHLRDRVGERGLAPSEPHRGRCGTL
jgi:xanthine dehydrogenase accessory factor